MNIEKIRKDFPILNVSKAPIYFDNACTTFKPKQVIRKIDEYYNEYPSCGGRSNHRLSAKVDEEVLKARRAIANFFNAKSESEIIFTRNTTEGLNLIANAFKFKSGDVVLGSDKEHNSNLLPWLLARSRGIKREIFKFNDIEDFKRKVKNAKLVSIVHTSNVDGTSNNVQEMTKIAHEHDVPVLIDAAQSAPHKEINVKKLGVDFLACSGHKMLGPSGIGVLYGKKEMLEQLNHFMVGGDTVNNTWNDAYDIKEIPERFEAGLQNYAGMTGFGEAVNYLKKIGLQDIEKHEQELNKKMTEGLSSLGIKMLGPQDYRLRSGIASFNVGSMSPHDVSLMLNAKNIMVRSGMFCVHSWFNANNIKIGSARASFYLYNTKEEVEQMLEQMKLIVKLSK